MAVFSLRAYVEKACRGKAPRPGRRGRLPLREWRRADEGVCPYVSVAPGREGVCAYVSLNLDGCKTMPLKVERDVD
jgi:hypothetical protein